MIADTIEGYLLDMMLRCMADLPPVPDGYEYEFSFEEPRFNQKTGCHEYIITATPKQKVIVRQDNDESDTDLVPN